MHDKSDINFLLFSPTKKCTDLFLPKAASTYSMARGFVCSLLVHQVPCGGMCSREVEWDFQRALFLRDKISQTVTISMQCREAYASQNIKTTAD